MRGIVVSVDFGDLLEITLQRNAQHFFEILVVTAPHDVETRTVTARVANAKCFVTDAFYRGGAEFNKGLAMEEGFNAMGRGGGGGSGSGWITVWDADTLLPDKLRWEDMSLVRDNLYVPPRRILADPRQWRDDLDWQTLPLKNEPQRYPGYCQIFHSEDPLLVGRGWYSTNWRHGGGCDTDFQRIWPADRKLRPPFEVLHLGADGQNWLGRVAPRLDGTVLPGSDQRLAAMQKMLRRRQFGPKRYSGEKLE